MRLVITSSVALLLASVACSSSTKNGVIEPHTDAVEHPDWVSKGSGLFGDGSKSWIGVGSAEGINNASLARTAADNRARDEISKMMEVYSASLMKDYMASTTAGDFSATSEEQHVESAIKTFSSNYMSGIQIEDHWIHPTSGTIYSLARLDMKAFQDQLDKMGELDTKTKERVKRAAEKAFGDLAAEEAKRAE